MRDTIKKTQHQNAQYAKLLALLLMHVEDDELLAAILRQVVEYKLPVVSVFGQFLPLVQKKMDVTPLKPIYEMLRGALESYEPSRAGIENRFAAVQDVFGELKTVDADEYTAMVRRWMDVEGISNNEHEL